MLRSPLLGLVFAGALAGCSYDWTIGSGTVSDLPPIFDLDSGLAAAPARDAAAPDGQAPASECGERCTCADNERCRFRCTKPPCELECEDRSNCVLACAPGAECTLSCSDRATCHMDCTTGDAVCHLACENGASCTGECRAGSLCTKECSRKCDLDCSGGGICR